ncbi:MAG: enoyl-CoA hydratase/isomerase family protein [Acidobacteria bacterium]|nr:enoyl-CoA hydratase/isomerase family protein [Acidobacteriota bacterium]
MNPTLVEVHDRIVTLTLNRPDKLNALVPEMAEGFREALRKASEPGVKALVLRGEGRGFCAGGDLGWILSALEAGRMEELEGLLDLGVEVAHGLRTLPKPVLALVNGPCAGAGLSLALGADLRIASSDAKFSMAFVKVGLHPDWGGSVLLHLAAGPSAALRLMLTGDALDAEGAKAHGLVHEVVDVEMLGEVGKVWAQRLAHGPEEAMARIKASALRNAGLTPDSLLGLLKAEGEQMKAAIRSADALEGMKAFLEKHAPKFA